MDPDSPMPYFGLGLVYTSHGKYDKAVEAFRKVIVLRPDFVEAYYNLGRVLAQQGEYTEAIRAYERRSRSTRI